MITDIVSRWITHPGHSISSHTTSWWRNSMLNVVPLLYIQCLSRCLHLLLLPVGDELWSVGCVYLSWLWAVSLQDERRRYLNGCSNEASLRRKTHFHNTFCVYYVQWVKRYTSRWYDPIQQPTKKEKLFNVVIYWTNLKRIGKYKSLWNKTCTWVFRWVEG